MSTHLLRATNGALLQQFKQELNLKFILSCQFKERKLTNKDPKKKGKNGLNNSSIVIFMYVIV